MCDQEILLYGIRKGGAGSGREYREFVIQELERNSAES
jgi:hypothetical protein